MSSQHKAGVIPRPQLEGFGINPETPIHQLFKRRMENDRDLKVVITARDGQTGVGKTTLACWLALNWHAMFASDEWTPENHATFDVSEFFDLYRELEAGSVLLMEEAEQLDSRRSMANENVKFSHYWMAMRVRQICSILTLPSTTALDKRLQQLADVWIEVHRRGKAKVHGIQVESYQKNLQTPKVHWLTWPDISDHPAVVGLDDMKEQKIDRKLTDMKEEEETTDPDEVKREQKIEIAQRMRDAGIPVKSKDSDEKTIVDVVGMSDAWVYNNTEVPQ